MRARRLVLLAVVAPALLAGCGKTFEGGLHNPLNPGGAPEAPTADSLWCANHDGEFKGADGLPNTFTSDVKRAARGGDGLFQATVQAVGMSFDGAKPSGGQPKSVNDLLGNVDDPPGPEFAKPLLREYAPRLIRDETPGKFDEGARLPRLAADLDHAVADNCPAIKTSSPTLPRPR